MGTKEKIKNFGSLTISDTGMVFDTSTGHIFASNPVGVSILNAMKEGKDSKAINSLIMKKFEVDEGTVEKDIVDFFNQLAACGLMKDE